MPIAHSPRRTTRPHTARGLFREHRPQSLWLPRKNHSPAAPRPTFVYLLVHRSENRFKIGTSYAPRARFALLPEADQIDEVRSLRAALPDAQRARQVESALHKALAGYRLQRLSWWDAAGGNTKTSAPWDGATEWFSLPGLRAAQRLLRSFPEFSDWSSPWLQTLDGDPYSADLPEAGLSPTLSRRLSAERGNLQRMDDIDNFLLVLSRRLNCNWQAGRTPARSAGTLRIEDLKTTWEPDMLKARFEVVSSNLWELQTGSLQHGRAVVPLVSLIRYGGANGCTLELESNVTAAIRKVPGGAKVCQRWMQLVERMPRYRDRSTDCQGTDFETATKG